VQRPEGLKPRIDAASGDLVQSGAAGAWWAVQVLNLRPHPGNLFPKTMTTSLELLEIRADVSPSLV